LKQLHQRFCCGAADFEKQQQCITRAWGQQHHSVISAIKEFESKTKNHKPNAEQKKKAAEGRAAGEKERKKVKRQAFVHDN
jgi:predicted DNA-binding WGR domain protein